ncbi:hypothetical protein BUN12_1025 [Bacillus amyloliquefaciens]|uniref:Uncharacterized MFS-type transporter yfiS n=1 Tax=Bacillus amyloliquefaciens (strain ATCC 23350 / DSM 7 / BCRC 11601 / CCUG 28519 / NBRC 15535 / NRRL B-14393 / F) TaxID=692420 RepID=A0A9P1NHW1_BACAS|nr:MULTISPECIES: MFS transporter [Bacillus amyloliquefaciens group]AZV89285.1 hypothetical protein BUN12_1025 [Bacillus amyloliquefaciens]MDR4377149.1 MFS transporter [Bacillus amyloliquefaciens]MEC1838989.1 MFS transporter [Bacillus amyloliquefaciens]MEC1845889.1 MFS transporter [Bacillus amyloliquefaciens]MEC1930733.1 MFS transporter [Bacillus amyloliquefaciens]
MDKISNSIWRNPRFTTYASGTLFNSLGNAWFDLALPLLIYSLTKSLSLMGVLTVIVQLPKILLGPFIGAMVDRLNPKKVIFSSYILQALLAILIVCFYYMGMLNAWLLLILGFLIKSIDLFARSSNFVLIPVLYPNQKIEANAGFTTVWTSSMLTGPVLGGLLLTFLAPIDLVLLDAITFGIMMFFLYLVRIPNKKIKMPDKTFFQDVAQGLKISFKTRTLRIFSLSVFLITFAVAPVTTIVIYYLKASLHFTDSQIGFITATAGFGMFSATLLFRILKKLKLGFIINLAYSVICIGLFILLMPGWFLIPIGLFCMSCGSTMYAICRATFVQKHCPTEYLARVNSTFQMIEQTANPLSMSLMVTIVGIYNIRVAIFILLLMGIISLIISLTSKLKSVESNNQVYTEG